MPGTIAPWQKSWARRIISSAEYSAYRRGLTSYFAKTIFSSVVLRAFIKAQVVFRRR